MLKVKFLGAAMTVTGSRTQVQYKNSFYLVDCGLFQGPHDIRVRNWEHVDNAHDVKAVILTHAHIDHSGYIPRFVKLGFRGPIYCSAATADLCKILLPDSGYLQEEDAKFANLKKYSRHSPALPLYTQEDAISSLKQLRAVATYDWVQLEPGLSFRLIRSGHMLGSTYVQFSYQTETGTRLLTFTGDLGNGRSVLLKEPTPLTETDELVLEATYGDRVQSRVDPKIELKNVILKVLGRGGTLVIPSFAVGRAQELLYLIHQLEKSGEIPQYDVYLDSPMALDATETFMQHPDELRPDITANLVHSPLRSARFIPTKSSDDSMLLCMNDEPKIVISAAGMLTGGRIMHHLKAKLPGEKNGVLFVGYQVEGTKGYLLKNNMTDIRIHRQVVTVEAEIFTIDSLSAHADTNDILLWLKHMPKKPKTIYLNHGEKNALEALQYRIHHELGIKPIIPQPDEEFKIL